MPTYEYKCRNCDSTFEEFHSMSAEPLLECPSCKTPNLYRIIGTGAGMIFKGSGFYLTDYKNAKTDTKESKPASKPSSNASNDSAKSETKSDSSSASTPKAKSD
ncbi:MAG: zinc ribbon domain-containing protein [Ignavibacteriales bacterium]|nr:zinc ribbon domain-containing protein [Ignavibacteriales bacterium]